MKIFSNKLIDNKRIIKIFGITIYETEKSYQQRIQKFLGGVISTSHKIFSIDNNVEIKIVKLCSIPFFRREITYNEISNYIFGIKVSKKNRYTKFEKEISPLLKLKDKNICILNGNIGEVYLFLTYCYNTWKKKIDNNVTFLVTKKTHVQLLELIQPNESFVYFKNLSIPNINDYFRIKNKTFFSIFSGKHYANVEQVLRQNSSNYFEQILNRLNIREEDLEFSSIIIHQNEIDKLKQKISSIGLNLNNFVFISPEASSCKSISFDFWANLCCKCHNLGLDIFLNTTKNSYTDLPFCKYISLDLKEAFILAQMSKKIITLRSGLSEFLLQTNKDIFSIYTFAFNSLSAQQILDGFSMKKLPFVNENSIHEYIYNKNNQNEILDNIITTREI